MSDTIFHELYSEGIRVPKHTSDPVCRAINDNWDCIDWNQASLPEAQQEACAELASELHYVYTKQLTMLGDIISNTSDMDIKRLATVLSTDHMRSADAWSKFLIETGVDTHVTDEMTEHLLDIEEDHHCCQLVTVICTGVFTGALYHHLSDEDTTFNQLLHRDAQQGAKNFELTARYMQRWMNALTPERRKAVEARLSDCITFMDGYVNTFRDVIDTAQIDADGVIEEYRTNVRRFLDRIQKETDQR